MDLDWILFDADGVIQGVRDGWLAELTAAGGTSGEDFVVAVFEAELATVSGGDFEQAMTDVLRRFEITRPLAEVIDPQYWIVVDAAMLAAVRALRTSGLRCGLATNQQNLRGAYMRDSLGYAEAFDAQFYSWELGVAKPHPDYFRQILQRTGTPAQRVLFLDDSEANVAGARSVGLRGELFPRGGSVSALHTVLAPYGVGL